MAASSLPPEHLLAAILSSTEEGLFSFALDGIIHTWSKGAERLYGYTEAEIAGHPLSRLLPPGDLAAYPELLASCKNGNLAGKIICERLHKSGANVRLVITRAAIFDQHSQVIAVLESARMVQSGDCGDHALLRNVLHQMPAALWTTDRDLRITSNWGSGMHFANVKPGELVGRSIYDFLKLQDAHAATVAQHTVALRGATSRFEFRQHNRDFEIRLEPLRDESGEIVGCVGAGIDITERKTSEERVRYQATHDALTGLANYRECLDTLEREVRRADRARHSFAVLLLDLDDLKHINDRWGHLAGNRALRRLAAVLKAQCRSTDLAARYGGDEFAILLVDADPGMARQIAERVEGTLEKDTQEPPVHVSIGIGIYPHDGRTASELLEAADRDLYRRKRSSRKQSFSAS
jgi:diguanylate cyclase (GGDEF)-like protein/PAS domain S-box-containing protein